jgi:hypothetical protein
MCPPKTHMALHPKNIKFIKAECLYVMFNFLHYTLHVLPLMYHADIQNRAEHIQANFETYISQSVPGTEK